MGSCRSCGCLNDQKVECGPVTRRFRLGEIPEVGFIEDKAARAQYLGLGFFRLGFWVLRFGLCKPYFRRHFHVLSVHSLART